MKLEAMKFAKILKNLNQTIEILGYEEIVFGGWEIKDGCIKFKFFDQQNKELIILLPLPN